MTEEMDIRWEQRFSNYNKALQKLSEAIEYVKKDLEESEAVVGNVRGEIIKEGLIQRFEYTYEMAWNVMKDYAFYQGNSEIGGSRDAIRYAFTLNLISDGNMWMDMIKSRIKTSHTYNEETAQEIYMKILNEYYPAFINFQRVMEGKRTGSQKDLFDKE